MVDLYVGTSHMWILLCHYGDFIMGTMASQINSLTIVYSNVYSGADQRKLQSSASLAFVRGIHRWPVNSPHKWPVTRKMFPFDDVIIYMCFIECYFMLQNRTVENLVPFGLNEEPNVSPQWFNSPSEKNCWSYWLDVNHDSITSDHHLLRQWRINTRCQSSSRPISAHQENQPQQ